MNDWEYKFNPMEFFLKFLLVAFIVNWFHEWFHLTALKVLGGDGFVNTGFLVFYMQPTKLVGPLGMSFVAFAGGLGSSLLCLIYYYTFSGNHHSILESKIVWRAVGLLQWAYGLVEGFLYSTGNFELIGPLGFTAMMLAAVYSFWTSKAMWSAEKIESTMSYSLQKKIIETLNKSDVNG
jgi:hypothetical protein